MFSPGNILSVRCPRCHCSNFNLSEIFQVSDVTIVMGGVVQNVVPTVNPHATGAVFVHCTDCDHRWRSRRSMYQIWDTMTGGSGEG